jgi:hypothetical protein
MTLDSADIEQIARRVADHLATMQLQLPGRFVGAGELAQVLGVERDWVYAHANSLGAIRLGGQHGRLRFDLESVRAALRTPDANRAPRRTARSRKGRARATRAPLIPYESDQLGMMRSSSQEGRA